MMEEVSITVACDASCAEQMSEEEILACLVSECCPALTVPTKKPKLREAKNPREEEEVKEEEDPVVKYKKENRKLHQVSQRLEQENDSLAHRLITSKIDLRNALDKAEDKVYELTNDLRHTKQRLEDTEAEKKGKEEETKMLKEVLRRELEKAELEARRSSGIIAEYKQICSQLTSRLEKQQAAHAAEKDALKAAVRACTQCQHAVENVLTENRASGSSAVGAEGESGVSRGRAEDSEGWLGAEEEEEEGRRKGAWRKTDQEREELSAQIRELEQELAQTKLQMVEAKCKIQDLEHQKGILANDLQAAKDTWFNKAFTTLRASGGGVHSMGTHRDRSPALGWSHQDHTLPTWTTKKISWPHRHNRGNV